MGQTIQAFVDKIRTEGIQAGQKEADDLLTQAKQQAEQIIAQAQQDKDKILAAAQTPHHSAMRTYTPLKRTTRRAAWPDWREERKRRSSGRTFCAYNRYVR